jgi:hypothetical protein
MRTVFGVEMPVRVVFETPTVEGLAGWIERAARSGEAGPAPVVGRASREEPLALSFAQERLWFLQQLEPGSNTYNMPVQVELSGVLHLAALSAALSEVVRRHESLRTTFVLVDGALRQRVSPPARVSLPRVDLSVLPAAAGSCEAERLEGARAAVRRAPRAPVRDAPSLPAEPPPHHLGRLVDRGAGA